MFLCSVSVSAQADGLNANLLFPNFEKGVAILKDGSNLNGLFNYSTIIEKVVFLDEDSSISTFIDPSIVGAVFIDTRVFENTSKNIFYERIQVGDDFYYIEWKAKWISIGKKGAKGQRSQSYGITSYQVAESGTLNSPRFTVDNGMEAILEPSFYLKIDNNFRKFNSVASLAKLVRGNKEEIECFAKTEQINFKKPDDVNRLMQFVSSKYM